VTVTVVSAVARPLLEPRLPPWVEPRWFESTEHLWELAPEAEIGWFDLYKKDDMAEAVRRAGKLKWLNSIYAGVDGMPLALMRERGVVFTNGVGINALTIAEYVVMGMLTVAKGYREVVRAQDRHEWLMDSPGKAELAGTKALLLGYGAIGKLIEARSPPLTSRSLKCAARRPRTRSVPISGASGSASSTGSSSRCRRPRRPTG
jgi:phosphoglycerate dehydrogenase-like enzyme